MKKIVLFLLLSALFPVCGFAQATNQSLQANIALSVRRSELFEEYKNGLNQKIDGPWKDVVFGDKVYDKIAKTDNSLITGKAEVIAEFASAKSTPDSYLDKLLGYTLSTPDAQQVESVAIIKLNTLMNKKLREHDLPFHMMSGFSVSEFMRNVDNTVR